MKKIVIATDSFKECLSGLEVADAIENGFRKVFPKCEYIKLAMADGGEGTVDSLVLSSNGTIHNVPVKGPLGQIVHAKVGFDSNKEVAFIEMAAASGLELLKPDDRNPMLTNTYGTGQLISYALDFGVKHIIIGIGGSATNDCGVGMASALGAKFLDANNMNVEPVACNLDEIEKIDLSSFDKRVFDVTIEVACDVENKLYGETGCANVFAKQKGADEEMIIQLEAKMIKFSNVLEKSFTRNPQDLIGGGAAGGLGVGLDFFCNGKLKSGVDIVNKYLEIEKYIMDADLVITGEGRMDYQSVNGKAPIGVAKVATKCNVDCIAICGSVDPTASLAYDYGIKSIFSVMQNPQTLQEAFDDSKRNIEMTAESIARLLK